MSSAPPSLRILGLAALLTLSGGLGCSDDDPASRGAGGSAGGGRGGAGASGSGAGGAGVGGGGAGGEIFPDAPLADAPATETGPPQTCGDIRNCRFACGTDQSCIAGCVSRAPAAARTQYQTLETCSRQACPTAEEVCRCDNECTAPNDCITLLEECVGDGEDLFCNGPCK